MTSVVGFVLLGVLVIYITVRNLWRPVILSLLYPWDVQLGASPTSTSATSTSASAPNPANTVAGSAAGAGSSPPPATYTLPVPGQLPTPGSLGLTLLGQGA